MSGCTMSRLACTGTVRTTQTPTDQAQDDGLESIVPQWKSSNYGKKVKATVTRLMQKQNGAR